MTPTAGSVTLWIAQASEGNLDAIRALWDRYYPQLVALAHQKLRNGPRALANEEDVALSAFDSVTRRAGQGQLPELENREDLWAILVKVASRKAAKLVQHERRQKRDHRRREQEGDGPAEASPLANLAGREQDPAFAAEIADTCRQLLALLPDEELKRIALMKLERYTNDEVAEQLNRPVSTIERRLARIRTCWNERGVEPSPQARPKKPKKT